MPSGDDRPKRRLPIVHGDTTPQQPQDADRPPWHWSAIGMVAIFLAWLPLAAAAQALTMRALAPSSDTPDIAAGADSARVAMIAPHLLAFAAASFAGGFLVGRFGGKAGSKEATIGGFLASALAWALAAAQPTQSATGPVVWGLTWGLILLVLGSLGSAVAYAGGRIGVRRRPPEQ